MSYLGLYRVVLALDDVVEGAPLALDVVAVQPVGRELEALSLQDLLALLVHLRHERATIKFPDFFLNLSMFSQNP